MPNDEVKAQEAAECVRRGTECLSRGDVNTAFREFNQALNLNPSDLEAYKRRAETRLMLSDFEHAIGDIDRVIKQRPDPEMFYLRGCARQELGDVGGSFADLSTAIRLKPDFADAYAARAVVQRFLGNPEAAETDQRRADELTPKAA